MRVLVTGAAGFIASHLCEKLVSLGHSVFGVDNFNNNYTLKQSTITQIYFKNNPTAIRPAMKSKGRRVMHSPIREDT